MGAHILVVDDDPLLAAALRRPLAYEGFEIEVAASGEEALSRALDHPPDLVILDVLLPGIDGRRCAGGCARPARWPCSC
jgi:two-component system response regulator MprA